jgi:hypothetical protein
MRTPSLLFVLALAAGCHETSKKTAAPAPAAAAPAVPGPNEQVVRLEIAGMT